MKQALEQLPHGPEFRFVDRLLALEPGISGVGEYTVRGDEGFLRGHFPGEPLLPGVLLLEAAAQLAGVVAQADPARVPFSGLKLPAIRAAKILGTEDFGAGWGDAQRVGFGRRHLRKIDFCAQRLTQGRLHRDGPQGQGQRVGRVQASGCYGRSRQCGKFPTMHGCNQLFWF